MVLDMRGAYSRWSRFAIVEEEDEAVKPPGRQAAKKRSAQPPSPGPPSGRAPGASPGGAATSLAPALADISVGGQGSVQRWSVARSTISSRVPLAVAGNMTPMRLETLAVSESGRPRMGRGVP